MKAPIPSSGSHSCYSIAYTRTCGVYPSGASMIPLFAVEQPTSSGIFLGLVHVIIAQSGRVKPGKAILRLLTSHEDAFSTHKAVNHLRIIIFPSTSSLFLMQQASPSTHDGNCFDTCGAHFWWSCDAQRQFFKLAILPHLPQSRIRRII